LVVDDSPDNATSWALVLRLDGHEVFVALDGLQALEVAARHRPDAVLLDLSMPRLDGFGTAAKLLSLGPDRPLLVAVTARDGEEDRKRCRAVGFDHHFTKPADPAVILELLQRHADSKA
jgi:CheY-like chemotaxis protein